MTRAAAVMATAALALSGCGSDSLSTTQLRTDASRICTATSRQINRIPSPTSPGGGTAFLKRGVAVLTPELTALRKLRPPSDLAHVYSSALHATADELSALRATLRQLEAGGDPVSSIQTLQRRLAPLESEANGAWQALEIPGCLNR